METGFDITIRKCADKSVYVALDCIECRSKDGKLAAIGGVGENFDNLEAALDYARGLHDATTIIQNQCTLVENTYGEEAQDEV